MWACDEFLRAPVPDHGRWERLIASGDRPPAPRRWPPTPPAACGSRAPGESGVGHATAAGAVTRYRLAQVSACFDVAVDTERERLVRDRHVQGRGGSRRPTTRSAPPASPVPALRLAFDPAGAPPLASPARLVRHMPGRAGGRVRRPSPRAAALPRPRRRHGQHPGAAPRSAGCGDRARARRRSPRSRASTDRDGPIIDERLATPIIRGRKAGTGRYRFPAAQLRRDRTRRRGRASAGPSTRLPPRRSTPRAIGYAPRPSTPSWTR